MEHERKFLINELPFNYKIYKSKDIEQVYICYFPEFRMRKINNKCYFAYKSNGKRSRFQLEVRIPNFIYRFFCHKYISTIIKKTRYFIPCHNSLLIEIDVYSERLYGLITAEVEFKSKKNMDEFIAPYWFGKEVTEKIEFKNKMLSKTKSFKYE